MLRSRIIPCLLVHNKGLVKTVKFKEPKYVGDPINAVKIFNEKEVDELIVLDIDATKENRGPNLKMIKGLADECRMPFCYGGGITTVEQAVKIISLGAEKIALSYSRDGIDVEQDFFKSYQWFLIFNEFKRDFSFIQQQQIVKEIQDLESRITTKQKENGQNEAEKIIDRPLKNMANLYKAEM